MSYNGRDVLHASLVVDILDGGGFTVIEANGIDLDSIVQVGAGQLEFELSAPLAPETEQNASTDASFLNGPGNPPLVPPLPHSVIAPNDDQTLRRLTVTDYDGGPIAATDVRASVMFYQFNPAA